jgi:major membrane immunogen (membrane-anchored lipoprotein)
MIYVAWADGQKDDAISIEIKDGEIVDVVYEAAKKLRVDVGEANIVPASHADFYGVAHALK